MNVVMVTLPCPAEQKGGTSEEKSLIQIMSEL